MGEGEGTILTERPMTCNSSLTMPDFFYLHHTMLTAQIQNFLTKICGHIVLGADFI